MNRKLIALDLALVALLVWAGYGLRQMWQAARAREAAEFRHKTGAVPVAPLTPLPNPPAVVPAKYKNIADKFLLSKDRNPDVPVEPPPPPPPEPPMPALPVFHGMMNLGEGPLAFMSLNANSPYETIRPGEEIGQFKLLSVNQKEIELEWHGKKVHKLVDELLDNSQSQSQAGAPQQQQIDPSFRTVITPQAAAPPPEPPAEKGPGEANQFGTAPCQQNDTTPFGTVRDGFRKIERITPFGRTCLWEQVGGK
jgi:hypothetical protein